MTTEKETEEQTLTPEQELEGLKSELGTIKTELEQTKKGLSTAHQTVTEKDKELKRQTDIQSQIQTLADKVELMAAYVASSPEEITELPEKRKQDLLGELKEKEKQRKTEGEQTQFLTAMRGLEARITALGLSSDTEEYVEIQDLAETGRFRMADIKLKKLESKPKTETPAESDDEKFAKRLEEEELKWMKKHNLLEFENATPAGTSTSATEAMKAYIAGNIDSEEAERRGVKFH